MTNQYNARPYEPRPQITVPETPPLTPPQYKEKFTSSPLVTAPVLYGNYEARQPAELPTPALSPDSSPNEPSSPTSPTSLHSPPPLTPADLPHGNPGTIGLGLGFGYPMDKKLESSFEKDFPLSTPTSTKTKSTPISSYAHKASLVVNRYKNGESKPMNAVAYFLRVPRRVRPALLLAISLFIIGMVAISRSVSSTPAMESVMHSRANFGRRYVENAAVDAGAEQQVLAPAMEASRVKPRPLRPLDTTPITFANSQDELLALIGFITAATGHSLPPHIDPSVPLEPSLLLGFDPSSPGSQEDFEFQKEEVMAMNPIVLFGRMRDPLHRQLIKAIQKWHITPEPLIIDVDQRRDHITFAPTVERILGSLPAITMHGKSMGETQELLNLTDEQFREKIASYAAVRIAPTSSKQEKARKRKQKMELERLLGPAPIVAH